MGIWGVYRGSGGSGGSGGQTSVVDVGGDLDVALLDVDQQLVEVFILLQGEVSSQWGKVPVLIPRVDQHGVIVVKLMVEPQHRVIVVKLMVEPQHIEPQHIEL